jgi:putative peptidoglycan lipid II flippase
VNPSSSANRQIARAAGTVMLAFLFSQLTGLAAKILIASAFDADHLDAFYVANRPAETLLTIMAGGILVSSFIPVFVKFLVGEDRESAWRLASSVANLLLIITIGLGALAVLFAWPIVQYLLGAGFPPDKQALSVDLLRIQAISIVFFGLSGLLIGILNSHQKFLLPALAPAVYQLGQIFGVLVLSRSMGIYGLAWGVVLGSALYLFIQVPLLPRLKVAYFPTLGLKDESTREVFRLMAPRMFGAAVVQLMVWVNTFLASHMQEGSVYGLNLGFALMLMAQTAIAQSVATAAMPTFSAQYAQGRLDELRGSLATTLRAVILLSMPATAGLILLRIPIITFLFQRNAFTAETTRLVAWALIWYTVGLIGHSVLEILVRAYYSMHDTRTPVLVGAAAMTMSIGLSLVLAPLFERIGWLPLGGLALAVSISTALEATTLFVIMRKRLNGIHGTQIARGLGAAAIGTLGMGIVLAWWSRILGNGPGVLTALGGVAVGGAAYAAALLLLRVPEVRSSLQLIRRKLPLP